MIEITFGIGSLSSTRCGNGGQEGGRDGGEFRVYSGWRRGTSGRRAREQQRRLDTEGRRRKVDVKREGDPSKKESRVRVFRRKGTF